MSNGNASSKGLKLSEELDVRFDVRHQIQSVGEDGLLSGDLREIHREIASGHSRTKTTTYFSLLILALRVVTLSLKF